MALDYGIIAVLLISASLSLLRGFTKEVLSIMSWLVSGYAAIFFGPSLKPLLAGYIKIDWVVNGGAMLIVFLVTFIVLSLLSSVIAGHLKDSPLGVLDRTMGVAFGAARGIFIACIAYLGVSAVIPEADHPAFITEAKLRPMLQTGSKTIVAIVPLDRLPLNLANIGKQVDEKSSQILQDALRKEAQKLGKETQDSVDNTGYKQIERDGIERLIRNTEGVK